jgi:hypothetical protein
MEMAAVRTGAHKGGSQEGGASHDDAKALFIDSNLKRILIKELAKST